MATRGQVLVIGGTGRTGRRVLEQMAGRGVRCRALVRSAARLPAGVVASPLVTVMEADLLSLSDEVLREQVRGCAAVVSCLGHNLSLRGLFGPPHDLVTAATARVCRAVEALRPEAPVRLVLMSSVSVHRGGGLDAHRGAFERAFLWVLRGVIPPSRDNQRAADLLLGSIGPDHPYLQWAAVRPDSLLGGEVSAYTLHEELVDGLFRPGHTRMANVAHFMCELATSAEAWERWRGKLPVITDAASPGSDRKAAA